jgi:Sec7-like guanine-nucleotide exchange factor
MRLETLTTHVLCRDEFCSKVLTIYVSGFDLVGLGFDDALRKFLAAFRLPGEAQKIDRIMHAFASQVRFNHLREMLAWYCL